MYIEEKTQLKLDILTQQTQLSISVIHVHLTNILREKLRVDKEKTAEDLRILNLVYFCRYGNFYIDEGIL